MTLYYRLQLSGAKEQATIISHREVPALPSFNLQRAVSHVVREHEMDYWTGTVYTTNRRVWEHDIEFKSYLQKIRAMAIDMETATIFTVGFCQSHTDWCTIIGVRPAHDS